VAVNADSIASWFLPGLADSLLELGVVLDVHLDDQDHTLALLKEGAVVGCLTTQSKPVAGCRAMPLGAMRYRCVAAPSLVERLRAKGNKTGSLAVHELLRIPAVCFNRKDRLQDQFLATHFGLKHLSYPRHYFPAVDAFHLALVSGIGWGMESSLQYPEAFKAKRLIEVFPGKVVDVPLYWQHYEREGVLAQQLTRLVATVARKRLIAV
jgi:LysR family transcriptional regulator, chromosome initiation inhibitor